MKAKSLCVQKEFQVRDLLEQIEQGLDQNLYYLSFFAALSLPDICGAADSDNGEASGAKYKKWFDDYVGSKYKYGQMIFLSGEDCYFFRCGVLHQGTTQHAKSGFSRILFVEPGATTNVLHCNIMNDALNIDVRIFCRDIVQAVRVWLAKVEGTPKFEANMAKFIRRHPEGVPPFLSRLPVIG